MSRSVPKYYFWVWCPCPSSRHGHHVWTRPYFSKLYQLSQKLMLCFFPWHSASFVTYLRTDPLEIMVTLYAKKMITTCWEIIGNCLDTLFKKTNKKILLEYRSIKELVFQNKETILNHLTINWDYVINRNHSFHLISIFLSMTENSYLNSPVGRKGDCI